MNCVCSYDGDNGQVVVLIVFTFAVHEEFLSGLQQRCGEQPLLGEYFLSGDWRKERFCDIRVSPIGLWDTFMLRCGVPDWYNVDEFTLLNVFDTLPNLLLSLNGEGERLNGDLLLHLGELQCVLLQQVTLLQQHEQHLHPHEYEQGQHLLQLGNPKNACNSHISALPSLFKSRRLIIALISLSK
jgi:hypothetical protein